MPSADESFIAPDLKKLDAELDDLFPEIKPISVKAEAKVEAKPAPAKAAPQAALSAPGSFGDAHHGPKGSTFMAMICCRY